MLVGQSKRRNAPQVVKQWTFLPLGQYSQMSSSNRCAVGILPPLSCHSASLELEQQLQSALDNSTIVACRDDTSELARAEDTPRRQIAATDGRSHRDQV